MRFSNPKTIATPFGPYSQVCEVDAGASLIFLSGCTARLSNGEIAGGRNMAEQADVVFNNIDKMLRSVGSEMTKIIRMTNYVTDIRAYNQIATVKHKWLKEPYPTSTLVQVAALNDEKLMIEVEVVALGNVK